MPPHTIISPLLLLLLLLFPVNGRLQLPGRRSPASRLTRSATRDLSRHHFISQQARAIIKGLGMEPEPEPSLSANSWWARLPLYSAADFGVGEYLAELEMGTPPRKFRLLADTGSDLTWVKCAYRGRGRGRGQGGRTKREFRADESASFKAVACGTRECSEGLADMFSLTTCPLPSAPCFYNYSYQSNSLVAYGIFGEEIITLPQGNHHNLTLPSIIGCTKSTQGSTIMNGADGVLGLSYSKHSFAYRVATKYGGGKFSYCLVDHLSTANVTGFLAFDGESATTFANIRTTRLFLHAIEGFYGVSIKAISVGRSMLKIPPVVWDVRGRGGAILDSGTSLTVLATPAYTAVMEALSNALLPRFPSLGQGSETQPFSYCFNSTGFKESMVPRLVIHFSDGARFEPHVKSYIIDDMPGIKCVGILEGPRVPYLSVLGNILQQNYLWEYDLVKEKLGFGSSACTSS